MDIIDKKKHNNKKPFPNINSFIVTVQILSYYDIQDEVVKLLFTLSHGTRAYVADKEDDLSQWLVTYPNDLSIRQYCNLSDVTRQFYKQLFIARAKGTQSYGKPWQSLTSITVSNLF